MTVDIRFTLFAILDKGGASSSFQYGLSAQHSTLYNTLMFEIGFHSFLTFSHVELDFSQIRIGKKDFLEFYDSSQRKNYAIFSGFSRLGWDTDIKTCKIRIFLLCR